MSFLRTLPRYFSLIWQACSAPFLEKRRWYGYLLTLMVLPLFLALQIMHWLLFLVDEILFRGYRQVAVNEPLFVLGPPRSGTTHLHHVLSQDERYTTFSAWECALGLSITARRLVGGLAWLDRRIGRPLGRLLAWGERRLLQQTGSVHPVSLNGPEEDFLSLMPLAQCFLLIVPFPRADWLWSTVRLDQRASDGQRRRLLRWYRRCIQKHLYVHGPERYFLSKNASFAGMASGLLEEFPDGRVLCCMREPLRVIPSQLSSLRAGLSAFGMPEMPLPLRDRLIDLLEDYYRNLHKTQLRYPERFAVVHNSRLHRDLQNVLEESFGQLGLDLSPAFRERLAHASQQSGQYRSAHRYTLEEYGLDADALQRRFAPLYDPFDGLSNTSTSRPSGTGMRILVFSDAIPQRNGVGAYYCDLIDQLRSAGWPTGFIGPQPGSHRELRIGMPGDPTQQVWLPSLRRVNRQLRDLAPNLVIAATPGPYGMAGLWWARRLGVPLLAGFHTDFPAVTAHYDSAWIRALSHHYFLFADRRLFQRADCVLGNSEGMLTIARERGARKTELIGTLLPSGMLSRPCTEPRGSLQRILFAGRLAPEKNVHTLIEAARTLPELHFDIAGDGPLLGEVQNAAAELPNLACHGWVSRDDLIARIDGTDLLVLPSELESFGNVALEAMARQRLALVSPGCGILDWPTLAPHLYRLDEGERVSDAISRIAALPASDRREQAMAGARAALQLNNDSLAQWQNLLTTTREQTG